MAKLLDYLATEFATFEEAPLNEVDSAAFSQLSMVRGEGIIPELAKESWLTRAGRTVLQALPSRKGEASMRGVRLTEFLRAERYEFMFTGPAKDETKESVIHMAASPRYRDVRVGNYAVVFDEETHTQFAAMTITYKNEFAYVAFRGTDTSLVGWREDFNMSFSDTVPAQDQALAYLEAVVPTLPKKVYVGGHSKGANLAEYAALKAGPRTQARLERVFLHDGPGFKKGMFTERDYAPLEGKLSKTVPVDSLVGMLLHTYAPMRIVKSDGYSLMQHNLFLWEVEDRDFVYADKLSEGGRILSDIADAWVDSYTEEERRAFVDALFTAIELSGATDALDLFSSPRRTIELLLEASRQVEEPMRGVLAESVKRLAEVTAERIGQNVSDLLPLPRR